LLAIGARNTSAAFVLLFFCFRFARLAFRPAAFFCVFAGGLRFGFGSSVAAPSANLRKIPAQLLVYFHNGDNITKPLGYFKRKTKLFIAAKTLEIRLDFGGQYG
jgi:hypothetical protein